MKREIVEEWLRIFESDEWQEPGGPSSPLEMKVGELYAKGWQGDRWAVDLETASLLTELMAKLAYRKGDCQGVRVILDRWLALPGASKKDPDSARRHRWLRADCSLHLGQLDEYSTDLESILALAPSKSDSHTLLLRLVEAVLAGQLSLPLADGLAQVAKKAAFRLGRRKKPAEELANAKTNDALVAALKQAVSMSEQAAAKQREKQLLKDILLTGEAPETAKARHQSFFDEWSDLAFSHERCHNPSDPTFNKRVWDLYGLSWSDGKWLRRPRESALATGLIYSHLCSQNEFDGALEVCDRWLAQPDIPEDEEDSRLSLLSDCAVLCLTSGREQQARNYLWQLKSSTDSKHERWVLRYQQSVLSRTCYHIQGLNLPDGVPDELISFAKAVLGANSRSQRSLERCFPGMNVAEFCRMVQCHPSMGVRSLRAEVHCARRRVNEREPRAF